MKTLVATTIILSLALPNSAFAINTNDTDPYVYLASPVSSVAGSIGSQPEIGSVFQNGSLQTGSNNFWKENGELLDRHSNEVDSSDISIYEPTRTGSQPGVGSVDQNISLAGGSSNFWAENRESMYRNNPLK